MVMSGADGVFERSFERSGQAGPALASTRGRWLALAVFAAGCGGEPGASDPVVDDTPEATTTEAADDALPPILEMPEAPEVSLGPPLVQGSYACPVTRTAITSPDGALLDTLDRLAGSYPIGGTWGAPLQLDYTPKEVPFEGEIVVSRRDGELVELGSCASGVEVPVAVTVRTNDGALAESVEGIVLLEPAETTVDGTPAPFRGALSARVALDAPSGSFAFADDPAWIFNYAELRAELTPFGTRGMLGVSLDPKELSGLRAVSPLALEPLLTWNGGDGCVDSAGSQLEPALFPAPTEARAALDEALEMASAETFRAKYADGTETRVALEFEPLSLLCATGNWAGYWHFPTRVHLKTDDARLDVSIGVAINPAFALLHYNDYSQGPGTYPPSRVDEQLGHVDAPVSDYAAVGIESWFDLTPEPMGWLKVLGYGDGACGVCDEVDGCTGCRFDERVEILSLFIGAEADRL